MIDGEESEAIPVTSDVPQGSVLVLTFFLIYINDLPDEVPSRVRLFADDTALYLTMESEDDSSALQTDLGHIVCMGDQVGYGVQPLKVSSGRCDRLQKDC